MLFRKRPSKQSAFQALQSGDYEGAIRHYRLLLEENPNDHELWNDLGLALLDLQQVKDALDCFQKANQHHEHAIHWNNMGRAYLNQKQFSQAAEALQKARKLDPKDPQPWFNLTVCLWENGKIDEAVAELFKFLAVFPTHAGAHNNLALYYEEKGAVERALSHLTQALQADPRYLPAHLNRIRLLCDAGRYPDSKPHLEFVAKQGAKVVVSAEHGKLEITIDGETFYQGTYRSS